QVVVVGRTAVLHFDLRDDQEVPLVFHVLVRRAEGPEQLRAGLLEVNQIIRVMQQAHPVGFRVPHPDLDLAAVHVSGAPNKPPSPAVLCPATSPPPRGGGVKTSVPTQASRSDQPTCPVSPTRWGRGLGRGGLRLSYLMNPTRLSGQAGQ